MKIGLYWTDENGVQDSMIDNAENALSDLIAQLNTDTIIERERMGEVSGSWENCETYNDYMSEFNSQASFSDGETAILIYFRGLIQGFSFSDQAAAGKASTVGGANQYNSEYCVVNGDLNNYDATTFKNFVKHEWLHLHGATHGDGAQWNRYYGYANSPMLTGYAESIRGGNQKPSNICNRDKVGTIDAHDGEISSCADVSSAIDSNY
jgi:hypothetical protein